MRGVADDRAAQGQQVVQVVRGVLGHAQRRWSGKKKFISTGHSVPGVIWKRMRTPSSVSSWPVCVISRVGAIRPIVPQRGGHAQAGADLARRRSWGAAAPYMYSARRVMAVPA